MARIIGVDERPPLAQAIPLSLQHLFAMFGASILVPLLFGIDSGVVLLMNGIGTLLFIFITKGKSPAYLGSSFAFLSPTFIIQAQMGQEIGFRHAQGGFIISGLLFCAVALLVKVVGTKWIDVVLPPAAMGPVIALIGLELAGTAANSAGLLPGDGVFDPRGITVFLITLGTAVLGSVLFRKFFGVIPILIAIVVGYIAACVAGIVDFAAVQAAPLFATPHFQLPILDVPSILIILPATLVVISEHIGHQLVTGKVIGRDLVRDPGLHRSLLGDGISTTLSGMVGAVPTTTYGENIGVMAITKVFSVWVIGGAAVISIAVAFIGKVSGAIATIPGAVMGGISFLLYGMIAASGLRLLVEAKVDYSRSRNLALTSVVLVTGLSGAYIQLGQVQLKGMALATVVGMLLSLVLYVFDRLKLTNDTKAE